MKADNHFIRLYDGALNWWMFFTDR